MHKLRTFIALEISADVRVAAQRLIRRLTPLSDAVKWVAPQHFHLTLSFLGDVEMLEVPQLCQAMRDVAEQTPPFDVLLAGAGAFPSIERPRTLWLGVQEGREELAALHAALDRRLAQLGFRTEQRAFHPHLTLGRVKGAASELGDELAAALTELQDYPGGATDVSELVLFSSELDRRGPTYEALYEAPLSGF